MECLFRFSILYRCVFQSLIDIGSKQKEWISISGNILFTSRRSCSVSSADGGCNWCNLCRRLVRVLNQSTCRFLNTGKYLTAILVLWFGGNTPLDGCEEYLSFMFNSALFDLFPYFLWI